ERESALDNHWFPCVLGPEGQHYIVDHHHFGLALMQEEVKKVSLVVLKDLSFVEPGSFWTIMDFHQWVHPYDAKGVRRGYDKVPGSISELQDDPYRSLAGALRRAGGFAKDVTPFSEFLWADFLRTRISAAELGAPSEQIQATALKLARSQAARYLPGWSGPIDA
ncbi:MAG: ParB-like protein, partial [Mycobacterium sp.]|nr:ParB-like protein [Mycobacterium sp.]